MKFGIDFVVDPRAVEQIRNSAENGHRALSRVAQRVAHAFHQLIEAPLGPLQLVPALRRQLVEFGFAIRHGVSRL
jgi:hypothetical protein